MKIAKFLGLLFFVSLMAACTTKPKGSENSDQEKYSIGDIRPYLRIKTIYYYDDSGGLRDVTDLPFIPLVTGELFGYVIPLRENAPPWNIKEILNITCDGGKKDQRVLEWKLNEGSTQIQSHNEFEKSDCKGKYEFQVYIQGFLADQFAIFVR